VLIPLSHFLHFAMMLDGRTPAIGRTILLATAVNIGLNLVLIPAVGLAGAALSGTLSYTVLVASSLWAGRLLPHLRPGLLRPLALAVSTAAMGGAAWAVRATIGGELLTEIPAAALAFVAAAFATRLWTPDEVRYVLRRRGRGEAP